MATTIIEQKEGWQVRATITGETLCETKEAIDAYLRRYPYAGYGTRGGEHITKRNENTFSANVTRARSAG